jgi:hypothetical protein
LKIRKQTYFGIAPRLLTVGKACPNGIWTSEARLDWRGGRFCDFLCEVFFFLWRFRGDKDLLMLETDLLELELLELELVDLELLLLELEHLLLLDVELRRLTVCFFLFLYLLFFLVFFFFFFFFLLFSASF